MICQFSYHTPYQPDMPILTPLIDMGCDTTIAKNNLLSSPVVTYRNLSDTHS